MLNPGKGVKASNNDLYIELKKRSMFTMLEKLCCGVNSGNANLDEDIANYHYFNTNYGDWDCNRHDNFDLKQAFFLRDWPLRDWPKDSEGSLSQDNLKYIIENNKTENNKNKRYENKKHFIQHTLLADVGYGPDWMCRRKRPNLRRS